MLLAASLAAVGLLVGPAQAEADPASPYRPVPETALTLAHRRLRPAQGGQRVRVTIPVSPGVNALGDRLAYTWEISSFGEGDRCQPGALPDLGAVTAGTVIDAPLPQPLRGWCRGSYTVELVTVVTVNCEREAPDPCRSGQRVQSTIASAEFRVGTPPAHVCHRRGDVAWCWDEPTYHRPARWSVYGLLDDLLGPDGATTDADPFLRRAFRGHPKVRADWEIDDDYFFGSPDDRAEALEMVAILQRALRAGPYHGKRWRGRMTLDRAEGVLRL